MWVGEIRETDNEERNMETERFVEENLRSEKGPIVKKRRRCELTQRSRSLDQYG